MALSGTVLRDLILAQLDALIPVSTDLTAAQKTALGDARSRFAQAIAVGDVDHITAAAVVNVTTPGVQAGASTLPGAGTVT
jgi:hypothetical protein